MFLPGDWVVHAVAFRRTDTNVIDWLRPNTTVRWQTYNVRDVDTIGVELGVSPVAAARRASCAPSSPAWTCRRRR